jgi:hypothetical protein
MKKKKIILENIMNYLFKEVSIIQAMTSFVGIVFIILFVKFFLVGIEEKLFNGYFETMVLGLLIAILLFVVPFYTKGWVGIISVILMVSGVVVWVYDSIILYRVATFGFSFFITLQILYKIFSLSKE